jgi:two-component system LytT family response regulator
MSDAVPIHAVVVDDEELARAVVHEYLRAHPDVQILAECANGFEAVKAVTELRPQILFLDVQMPKLTGFEVLELIERPPAVVFTTAYDEYALKAFEVHAVDYLLKPFGQKRFDEALDRARKRIGMPAERGVEELARSAAEHHGGRDRILIREGARVVVLPVEKVDVVEAEDDYVRIRAEGKEYRKQVPLGDLEKMLPPQRFVRVHRSILLNVDRLAKLELYAKDSRVAILKDGTRLPVSRSGYARLKELL